MGVLPVQQVRTLIERTTSGEAVASGDGTAKYNGMADPAGAEELGRELAGRLAPHDPSGIVVWEDAEDVVLGHVVARELGVRLVRAYDADGLVGTNGPLPEAPRLALLADAVRDPRVVLAARALAAQQGGALVATAVLVETPALASVAAEAGEVITLMADESAQADPAGSR